MAETGGPAARQTSRVRLVVVGVVIAVLLSGCVVRVVYNQLDWLALWYVDDYFDLDATQKAEARELISRTLRWHRSTQLPRYSRLSTTIWDRVGVPVTPKFVADLYAETVVLWDDLLRHVGADAGLLLQTLSDEQVEDLLERMAEGNAEFAEEYSGSSAGERRAKQDKAILKMFTRFTGRLSNEQKRLVRSRTAKLHDLSAEWLNRRAAWQREFRSLLDRRRTDPQFATHLTSLMLEPNQFDSPGYRSQVEDNQQRVFSLVAEVMNTLSPAQAEHLRKRLTGYREDFDVLIREGADPKQAAGSGVVGSSRGAEERT